MRASCWRMPRMSDPAGRFSRCRQRRETPSAVPVTLRRTRVVVLTRSKYVSERTADSIGSPMVRSTPKNDAKPQRLICWHVEPAYLGDELTSS